MNNQETPATLSTMRKTQIEHKQSKPKPKQKQQKSHKKPPNKTKHTHTQVQEAKMMCTMESTKKGN